MKSQGNDGRAPHQTQAAEEHNLARSLATRPLANPRQASTENAKRFDACEQADEDRTLQTEHRRFLLKRFRAGRQVPVERLTRRRCPLAIFHALGGDLRYRVHHRATKFLGRSLVFCQLSLLG